MKLFETYYDVILEEKTLSIHDKYWDTWFDGVYLGWYKQYKNHLDSIVHHKIGAFGNIIPQGNLADERILHFLKQDDNINVLKNLMNTFSAFNIGFDSEEESNDESGIDYDNISLKDIKKLDKHIKSQILQSNKYTADYAKRYYATKYHEKLNFFRKMADKNNGNIKIYRMIGVPDDYLNHLKSQGKNLGVYWSWKKSSVEAYWAHKGKREAKDFMILSSTVNEKYIFWERTLLMNISYEWEREIRVQNGVPLKITNLTRDTRDSGYEDLNVDAIKDKIFYA